MTNKRQVVKKNLSSMQVLKTLKLLMEDNYTMKELVDKLNQNEDEPIFNNSVVSKYINTCRYCGIEIPKINNKYFVAGLPFGINFTVAELEMLYTLQQIAEQTLSTSSNKKFKNFISTINKYSNKQITKVTEKTSNITCSIFERAIRDNNKVRLMLISKQIIDCVPLRTIEHKNKIYFNVYFLDKEHMIAIDRISGMQILNDKFKPLNSDNTVIYKLKGDLAKRYQLRENEHIIAYDLPISITIANKGEPKDILFTRLLRYDVLCEIEHPKFYREELKQIIEQTLKNYGD